MVMSFETINQITNFDSLSVNGYYYYDKDQFRQKNTIEVGPQNLISSTLPHYLGGVYDRRHLSLEGKILQNISLENMMVRYGDQGRVRTWDLWVIHSLLYRELNFRGGI
ncbi:hypothetical protein Hanom_Chr03g00186221 [Helianthus anomalus]